MQRFANALPNPFECLVQPGRHHLLTGGSEGLQASGRQVCKNGVMAKPSVLVLQHVDWERPGRILENLQDCGLETRILNIVDEKKPELPHFKDLAGVVIMGGPMSADDYEHHPGLKAETKLARAAVGANKPFLGICLGHQILARALGGDLIKNKQPEHGMAPIRWVGNDDDVSMWSKRTDVLHWHGDQVSLPPQAKLLARSRYTEVQAFRFGSGLGLQFHLEVTAPLFDEWMDVPQMTDGFKKSQIAQMREDFQRSLPQMQPLADSIFSAFAARCQTNAAALESA